MRSKLPKDENKIIKMNKNISLLQPDTELEEQQGSANNWMSCHCTATTEGNQTGRPLTVKLDAALPAHVLNGRTEQCAVVMVTKHHVSHVDHLWTPTIHHCDRQDKITNQL